MNRREFLKLGGGVAVAAVAAPFLRLVSFQKQDVRVAFWYPKRGHLRFSPITPMRDGDTVAFQWGRWPEAPVVMSTIGGKKEDWKVIVVDES
mgnify:CR=1 FL=1